MFQSSTRHRTLRAFLVLALPILVGLVSAAPAAADGRHVMSPGAHPFGFTLDRMTSELALFSASGNDPQYYPDTPFQILYNSDNPSFAVKKGTPFFVPLWNADDSPPIVGTFPSSSATVGAYFFDPTQLGARGFEVIIDGRSNPIGPEYLGGPVTTPTLPDHGANEVGGTHMITLGAFIAPLHPGHHTVTIRGGLFGDAIFETYGVASFSEAFTYAIDVSREH